MYSRSNVLATFRNLIGLRTSYNSLNYNAQVDEDLSESQSGQYVNELHPLLTTENLTEALPFFQDFFVAPYEAGRDYPEGAVVQYDAKTYQAKEATDQLPTHADWRETTLLSVWFRNRYDAAVLQLLDRLIEKKQLGRYGRQLQGNTALYHGEGLRINTIPKQGRFVGYKVTLSQTNLTATLQRLGLQFSEATSFPLYVFHSTQTAPVAVRAVSTPTPGRFNYADLSEPVVLDNPNGYYLIGYYEQDVAGQTQAIRLYNHVFVRGNCQSCQGVDAHYRAGWNRYVSVDPMYAKHYTTKGALDFTLEDLQIEEQNNYGLNLTFSFRCDISDLLIREKQSLTPALKAQLRVSLLESLYASLRVNSSSEQIAIMAYNALNTYEDPENPKKLLAAALDALDFEFSGMNPLCFPCNDSRRIKNRVIG
jgi:hypothetical protein